MRTFKNLLITGGAGFIGSNLIRTFFGQEKPLASRVINLDKLTYAGIRANTHDIEGNFPERYKFIQGDICDSALVREIFESFDIDAVCHLAAESHVDRSIFGPQAFITTNIQGTFTLLETARVCWKDRKDVLFHHVSTDEVFGSLGENGYFSEGTPYDPRSPYSASKASSDHLVRAYHHTYGLPVTITNCSNNYGPYQFPEKLIPLMILNALQGKPLPVYGDGKNVRDWLHVTDHNRAVIEVMRHGTIGESYNVGGENEWQNIQLVTAIAKILASLTDRKPEQYTRLITFVPDRPGHDRRYAIDCSKIKSELGWTRDLSFEEGLRETVKWYVEHTEWCEVASRQNRR